MLIIYRIYMQRFHIFSIIIYLNGKKIEIFEWKPNEWNERRMTETDYKKGQIQPIWLKSQYNNFNVTYTFWITFFSFTELFK